MLRPIVHSVRTKIGTHKAHDARLTMFRMFQHWCDKREQNTTYQTALVAWRRAPPVSECGGWQRMEAARWRKRGLFESLCTSTVLYM